MTIQEFDKHNGHEVVQLLAIFSLYLEVKHRENEFKDKSNDRDAQNYDAYGKCEKSDKNVWSHMIIVLFFRGFF